MRIKEQLGIGIIYVQRITYEHFLVRFVSFHTSNLILVTRKKTIYS